MTGNTAIYFFFLLIVVCIWSVFYLLKSLKQSRQLTALIGLFCLAMGFFLLVLDLTLIAFTQGPRYIADYLRFNRLVSDTGFAGRWVLTVYVFIGSGIMFGIYLLARSLITKLNKKKDNENSQESL